MARTALLLFLFLALALANDSLNLPPDDQDGSGGDDEDMFSGSGYAPIPDVSNAEQTTIPSSTSDLSTVQTENQHPIVPEPEMTKEPETIPTTRVVETERPIVGPNEVHNTQLSAEKNVTTEHTAVLLEATSLTPAQPDTDKTTMSHAIFPEVPNIPQEATTAAATQTTEPHKHHHHHHHGHHHETTTAAPVTEAADTHMHHDLHPETTSSIAPNVLHDHVDHDHQPESGNATESDDAPPLPTQDSLPMEEDTAIEQTTIQIMSSSNDSKPNIPVVVFDNESETDRKDSADFEGSGDPTDAADFYMEPAIPQDIVPESKSAIDADGVSETSKGLMEQKGVLAAVIAGGVAGLVLAIGLVGFMLYRMKKKDEGSYCLEETKQTNGGYEKPIKQEEFYA